MQLEGLRTHPDRLQQQEGHPHQRLARLVEQLRHLKRDRAALVMCSLRLLYSAGRTLHRRALAQHSDTMPVDEHAHAGIQAVRNRLQATQAKFTQPRNDLGVHCASLTLVKHCRRPIRFLFLRSESSDELRCDTHQSDAFPHDEHQQQNDHLHK